jgi:hypothetical protein
MPGPAANELPRATYRFPRHAAKPRRGSLDPPSACVSFVTLALPGRRAVDTLTNPGADGPVVQGPRRWSPWGRSGALGRYEYPASDRGAHGLTARHAVPSSEKRYRSADSLCWASDAKSVATPTRRRADVATGTLPRGCRPSRQLPVPESRSDTAATLFGSIRVGERAGHRSAGTARRHWDVVVHWPRLFSCSVRVRGGPRRRGW